MDMNLLRAHHIDSDESLFAHDQYKQDCLLRPKDEIVLEAKRLILTEQIEKLANITLSEVYPPPRTTKEHRQCKQPNILNYNNWEDVPRPQKPLKIIPSTLNKQEIREKNNAYCKSIFEQIEFIKLKHENRIKDQQIVRKYFIKWKECLQKRSKSAQKEMVEQEKIDKFFKALKKQKNLMVKPPPKPSNPTIRVSSGEKIPSVKFENRYKAQQNIIIIQKNKLLEKEREIEELKYGKICEELHKSLEESRTEMKDLIRNCSVRTKCKMGLVEPVDLEEIEVRVNKVPKMVKTMEKRAEERAAKRQIIKERKRVIDEERKRLAEELVETKRIQDEDEKRKNLEAIKEHRRKEVEMDRLRQINKQRYLAGCTKADKFYKRKMKRVVFKRLRRLIEIRDENFYKSCLFYDGILIRKSLERWRMHVEECNRRTVMRGQASYRRLVLRKCLKLLNANRITKKQNYQVAVDFYNLKLQCWAFKEFHLMVCKQQMRLMLLYRKAVKHHNSRMLVQYFYQWKCLPAVLQLEKAKEEKKKKWREKVLEILPDYKPQKYDKY